MYSVQLMKKKHQRKESITGIDYMCFYRLTFDEQEMHMRLWLKHQGHVGYLSGHGKKVINSFQ